MERVTGTLVWYYHVCKREVWLIAHEINPDQDNPYLEIGRLIHEDSYKREKKKFATEGIIIDLITVNGKDVVVGEVKKSSRFVKQATMQLAFYLWKLKQQGVKARGELLVPKEKKKISVELTEDIEKRLIQIIAEIKQLIHNEFPPVPAKISYCKSCAYREFCWS